MQVGPGVPPGDGSDSGAAGVEGAMLPVGEYRELVVRGREGLRLARGAMPSWHESLATLVIGTLSTGLGVAALAALAVWDRRFDLVYAAFVGHWLGIGGIFWALRIGRGMSPLSVLGTALCLVVVGPLYVLAVLFLLGMVSWMVLSVWVVRAVLRVLGG
jgi:hypothetical protein